MQLTANLPEGITLTVTIQDKDEYPGIRINRTQNGITQPLALLEYDKDRLQEEGRLRLIAWADNEDEASINFSFKTGENDAGL